MTANQKFNHLVKIDKACDRADKRRRKAIAKKIADELFGTAKKCGRWFHRDTICRIEKILNESEA